MARQLLLSLLGLCSVISIQAVYGPSFDQWNQYQQSQPSFTGQWVNSQGSSQYQMDQNYQINQPTYNGQWVNPHGAVQYQTHPVFNGQRFNAQGPGQYQMDNNGQWVNAQVSGQYQIDNNGPWINAPGSGQYQTNQHYHGTPLDYDMGRQNFYNGYNNIPAIGRGHSYGSESTAAIGQVDRMSSHVSGPVLNSPVAFPVTGGNGNQPQVVYMMRMSPQVVMMPETSNTQSPDADGTGGAVDGANADGSGTGGRMSMRPQVVFVPAADDPPRQSQEEIRSENNRQDFLGLTQTLAFAAIASSVANG